MQTNTQTGSYIALAGLAVSILAHFGFIISQSEVITIIAGIVTVYGVIHQHVVTNSIAKVAGLK